MKRQLVSWVAAALLILLFAPVTLAQCGVKNIVIMVADGWGYNQILTTNYWNGIPRQAYENFPIRLPMATYSLNTIESAPGNIGYDVNAAWVDFNYLKLRPTDSASAATAMSTGVKAYDGQVSVDPFTQTPLLTTLERAEELGKATGVITSVEWSHATPAGWAAHNESRSNYAQIAQEMLAGECEVIMGCGHPYYTDNNTEILPHPNGETAHRFVGGVASWTGLQNGSSGWTLIQNKSEFVSLISDPHPPTKVCGTAKCATTLQQARTPGESGNSFTQPYTVPLNVNVPTLAEMSLAALNVLQHADAADNGLFLMIEGGAVDWANHANQGGRLIEEMNEFNAAVEAVIAWIEANSDWTETLLMVTGDHETGYLWGRESGLPATWNPVINNGYHMMPAAQYYSGSHTNSLVPFFAKGVGSAWFNTWATEGPDVMRGYYFDNTKIADVCFGYFDCTLAAELVFFDANVAADGIALAWRTASETNNDHFEIKRDGQVITTILGQGNTPEAHDYAWTDHSVQVGVTYNYTLIAVDFDGSRSELAHQTVTMSAIEAAAVRDYTLYQNYPNPFNPTTTVRFDLPEAGFVSLKIYNPLGQLITTLVNDVKSAGSHDITFDAAALPAGTYLCRMEAGEFSAVRKLLLVK